VKLRYADVTSALQLQKLVVPMSPFLTGINMDGKNQMTTATIDNLIESLHSNIVSNNIRDGFFSLRQSFTMKKVLN
jgi:hypothetical protein